MTASHNENQVYLIECTFYVYKFDSWQFNKPGESIVERLIIIFKTSRREFYSYQQLTLRAACQITRLREFAPHYRLAFIYTYIYVHAYGVYIYAYRVSRRLCLRAVRNNYWGVKQKGIYGRARGSRGNFLICFHPVIHHALWKPYFLYI